ncbi:MAG: hypothetical protein IJD92_05285 [Bacilli bacterium]|nr:hypothetical protein [Bacilli bacterium]
MLIYKNEKEIITTSIDDIFNNVSLISLYSESESFRGKDNRFFKVLTEETLHRNIKHLTRESIVKETKKKYKDLTQIDGALDFYDKNNNVGYTLFPYRKKPTIYSYTMIYPAITEFFRYWKTYNYTGQNYKEFLPKYDLSNLFDSMENFKNIELLFNKAQGEILKKALYNEFPEFAIFYYEIYPNIKLTNNCKYDIKKLIQVKDLMNDLAIDTKQIDVYLKNIDIAENNRKVLKLINNSK